MSERKRTEIAELGEFGLIDSLTVGFESKCKTTLRGVGDDAAVIKAGRDDVMVVTTDSLLEGVDFDLTYFPLKHLGYTIPCSRGSFAKEPSAVLPWRR